MSDPPRAWIVAMGGLFAAAVCCAVPLLIVALGSLSVGSALASGSYLVVSILAVVLGWVGLRLYQRRASAQPCCDDRPSKEGCK